MDKYFGKWINDIHSLNDNFINTKPFPYIVIDNFLNNDFIELVYNEFPDDYTDWHKYNNPLEVKYTFDNISNCGNNIKKLFELIGSKEIIEIFENITNIPNLSTDPLFHGCGLHVSPRNGRLAVHLDYEKHPLLDNKQRRLNLIIYLSKNWKPEWNGDTELWNDKECVVSNKVSFNTVLLFKTSDDSWHGVPKKIL